MTSTEGEVHQFSAETQAQLANHAGQLRQIETYHAARKVALPTRDDDVRLRLRAAGLPIHVFGETKFERRQRLATLYAAYESRGRLAPGQPKQMEQQVERQVLGVTSHKEVYTHAPEDLQNARRAILSHSLEKARIRTLREQAERTTHSERHKARHSAANKYAASLGLTELFPRLSETSRPLTSAVFGPSGAPNALLTTSMGGVVELWNSSSDSGVAQRIGAFSAHESWCGDAAWHPAAQVQFRSSADVAGEDLSAFMEEAYSGGSAGGMEVEVDAVRFEDSDDNEVVGVGNFQVPSDLARVSLNPLPSLVTEGPVLHYATASQDNTARLWTLEGHQNVMVPGSVVGKRRRVFYDEEGDLHETPGLLAVLKGHSHRLSRVTFHPAGRHVATSSYDHTWRLWDAETAQQLLLQDRHSKAVYGLDFHPDGSLVGSGGLDSVVRVWDTRSGDSIASLLGHTQGVFCVAFSGNGYQVATAGGDHTIKVWNLRTMGLEATIPAHSHNISRLEFSPGSELLMSTSYDKTVKIWKVSDWRCVRELSDHQHMVWGGSWSSDSSKIATATYSKEVSFFSFDPYAAM